MTDTRKGGCLCGKVRFEADISETEYHVCHCGDCRKWDGGPSMACGADAVRVEDESALTAYSSSDYGERVFCTACGTHLFWRMKDGSMTVVWLGALDNSDDLTLTLQMFIDKKPDHYAFANKTKEMTGEEVFAHFGGGG